MKPPIKPMTDKQFIAALKKTALLDARLQPILTGIYGHLYEVLPRESDRELLGMYGVLLMGSDLSLYAPRELLYGDCMAIFTTWAKKAERLLRSTKKGKLAKISKPGTRKRQNKAVSIGLEGRK